MNKDFSIGDTVFFCTEWGDVVNFQKCIIFRKEQNCYILKSISKSENEANAIFLVALENMARILTANDVLERIKGFIK